MTKQEMIEKIVSAYADEMDSSALLDFYIDTKTSELETLDPEMITQIFEGV
jgi:hypothetical protein